jgi:hypothetical protein
MSNMVAADSSNERSFYVGKTCYFSKKHERKSIYE